MNLNKYVVWDLETTGLDPKKDRIVEIAAAIYENGVETKSFSVLINHPDFSIPKEATAIHGITDEMCRAEGIRFKDAACMLMDYVMESYHNVTHNGIKFDIPFFLESIKEIVPKGAFEIILQKNALDTAVLYKAMKLEETQKADETFNDFANRIMNKRVFGLKYNVGVCCDEFKIDRTNITQHRAAADVFLTNKILDGLVRAGKFEGLMAMAEDPSGKGKPDQEPEITISLEMVDKCAKYLAAAMIDTNAGELKLTLENFSFNDISGKDIEIIVRESKPV